MAAHLTELTDRRQREYYSTYLPTSYKYNYGCTVECIPTCVVAHLKISTAPSRLLPTLPKESHNYDQASSVHQDDPFNSLQGVATAG